MCKYTCLDCVNYQPSETKVVRVLSLKRKAAWKRFYKLFPHLKGKSVIHGSCQPTVAYGVNPSMIKLKKVKK